MKNFSTALKQYGTISAGIIAASVKVGKSQIHYTNPPDIIVSVNGATAMDIDQDLMNDFDLEQHYFYYCYWCYGAGKVNRIWGDNLISTKLMSSAGGLLGADRLLFNDTISSAKSYSGAARVSLGEDNDANWNWSNGSPHTDQYLGVRMDKGNYFLYGWVRLDYNAGSSGFTVKDFAINTIPDSMILAGDSTRGMYVKDTVMTIDENLAMGSPLGIVKAYGSAGTPISFSIASGNPGNAFQINSTTGEISVNNSTAVDFETTPVFDLIIEATDGTYTNTGTVRISLMDVDEAPVMVDQTFSVAEKSPNGTSVGTVVATDETTITFSFTTGNFGDAFAIDGATGEITVNDSSKLDFQTTPVFTITVIADDGGKSTSAIITINLTDGPVGVKENKFRSFTLYPNPANAEGGITVKFSKTTPATVEILNLEGRQMALYHDVRNQLLIPTEGWAKGVYFVNVRSNNKVSTKRLVIQ